MKQVPSPESSSALIECWATEYERLYGTADSALPAGAQIPPAEMKKYIDDFKKWYESATDKSETQEKLSVLRRVAASWQLNVNTINKLIKYMEATLATLVIMVMCGCQSGMYQIDAEKCTANNGKRLAYRIVDKLEPESYSEEYLPVEVIATKSSGADDSVGLCILTLGIIPAFYDKFETINVTVKSPIGTKTGSGTVHAKKWLGWICLIPYPGSAEERSDDPELPNDWLERRMKNQIVDSLVSQYSMDEYASFVEKVKAGKAREEQRVQKKKKMLEHLVEEGKFEDVIKACRAEKVVRGKENPWAEISDRAFTALKKSIPTMTDSGRLVSLFAMVDDITLKDAIVIRLGALGRCSELGEATLVRCVAESPSEKGRLSAVKAIVNEDSLDSIAKAKYSKAITIAAFKKLNADKIRADIFKGTQIDEELAAWYIDAYGTDQELIAIIKLWGDHLGSGIEKIIRTRTSSGEVLEELSKKEARIKASKFSSSDVDEHLFYSLLREIESVLDPASRTALAECLLDRHMHMNNNSVDVSSVSPGKISKFTSFLSAKYCKSLFSNLRIRGFREGVVFGLGLLKNMREIDRQEIVLSTLKRLNDKEVIHFEGFYVGMSWRDFCVMCYINGKGYIPDYDTNSIWNMWHESTPETKITRIRFERTARYAMFEKEDGEFWSAYLRKYVPSPKKRKSITETIGDVLDSGTFDYQKGWDDHLREWCYIYKSMKYGTRVLFGEKSGTLVLEEYK